MKVLATAEFRHKKWTTQKADRKQKDTTEI